jgi:phage shock protein C
MSEDMQPGPRRLYQDRENKLVCGVCAGIADYFGFDVTVTRVLVLAGLVFFLPPTLIGYIVLALLLPKKPNGNNVRHDSVSASLQRSVRSSPQATLDNIRYRFRELDGRLQRLEKYMTSKRFDLDREFESLKD